LRYQEERMAQVLIRDLDPGVVLRLKARARERGRSLEAELRGILEAAAAEGREEGRALAARIRRRLSGRAHSDSAALLAEDRAR
jgi:plasmid stability protein